MHHLALVPKLPDGASIIYPAASKPFPLPLYQMSAGYPSPAQDYLEKELDLNSYMLGQRRASVFLFKITGNSMKDAGILQDDIIIVDRAITPKDGDIVVASIFGEFTCKYYRKTTDGVWLVPANSDYKPRKVTEEMEFTVFGVYDGLIRKNKGRTREPFSIPFA